MLENKIVESSQRVPGYDLLRVISCLVVIFGHATSEYWFSVPVDMRTTAEYANLFESSQRLIPVYTGTWWILSVVDALIRFQMGAFVFASGAFVLNKYFSTFKDSIRYVLRKCLKLAVFSFVWSFFSTVVLAILEYPSWDLVKIIKYTIALPGAYWFLLMLGALYLTIPMFNKLLEHKETTQWFLVLWFVIEICFVFLTKLIPFFDSTMFAYMSNIGSYAGFFVAGGYFRRYGISLKNKHILYAGGGIGLLVTIFGQPTALFHNFLSPSNVVYTLACCVAFVELGNKIKWTGWKRMSKYTTAAYPIHLIMRDIFFVMIPMTWPWLIRYSTLAIGVEVATFLAAPLVAKIKLISKWLT